MKKIFIFLFVIFVGICIVYIVPAYRQKVINTLSYSKCDKPLEYKIGSIDQRFNLTGLEALNYIKIATDVWSTTRDKELFKYSQDANLTVNFVYDERQALDTQIDNLKSELNQKNTTLQQKINEYKAQVASYEQRLDEFNAKVDKYNREGGAPSDVYADLIYEQNQLKAEGEALNSRARELNLSTSDYNAGVSELNQNVGQFNDVISQKPEEGSYEYLNGKETISIYFVGSRGELLHTLAHEFGHALGISHVVDKTGIMYPYTTTSLTVSPDDISQLEYACREQWLFVHLYEQFNKWLAGQFNK